MRLRTRLVVIFWVVLSIPAYMLSALQGKERKIVVDAMVDFRRPVSFVETVHTAIAQILFSLELQVQRSRKANTEQLLDNTIETLQDLDGQVDRVATNKHQVKEEDKEFLQSMIDRIDSLIAYLEQEDEVRAATIKQLCGTLKEKLAQV